MHVNYLDSIRKNKTGKAGAFLLLMMCALAILAPFLTLHAPAVPSPGTLQPPSAEHWLGTNDIGQDIWSRVIYGTRTSLLVAFAVGTLTTLLSLFWGGSAALLGGIYERIVLRVIDVLLILPHILVLIIIAAYLRPGTAVLIILLSLLGWQGGARIIRAQTLSLKERVHVSAARTFGAGNLYILARHIIPDLMPVAVACFVQSARRAVFMEAGLAFLGVTDPTVVSWGLILNNALEFSYLNVWNWIFPAGIALALTILAFTFLGYALEEILNPRLRTVNHA